MQIHRDIENLPSFKNAVITIGTFDGVHLGHRQIIHQLKAEALHLQGETVIITFHPHPRKIIASTQSPIHLLNTISEKIELFSAFNIDHLAIVHFNEKFSLISAQDYIEQFLVQKFNPHTIIIGYDHHFGQGRTGNYLLLEEYSTKLGFRLIEISPHIIAENTVSSTRIRQSLENGIVAAANGLLGYEYFFEGRVIEGNRLGRTLGYPTANLEIQDKEKLIPGNGIYVVEALLREDPLLAFDVNDQGNGPFTIQHKPLTRQDNRLKGMMSIGTRPTLSDGKFMIEINIFDFNQDIYGRILRVFVREYLRPELKFNSLEGLKQQLHKDKTDTLKYFTTL